jgi:hypothetical protein
MKKFLTLLWVMIIALASIRNAYGERIDTLMVQSKITDVVVFFSGAQVTRKAKMKTSKGKHIFQLKELPFELNPQSIQVRNMEQAVILSVKHELIVPKSNIKNQIIRNLENSIKDKKLEQEEMKNKIAVLEMEQQLVLHNNNLSSAEKGLTVTMIKEAADFYRIRLNEIKSNKLTLEKSIENNQNEIKDLYQQINAEQAKRNKAWSEIYIAANIQSPENMEITLSYYIPSAAWEALYDFRVEDISKPLFIHYNALITQNSGENWDNVNIRLSNADPSLTGVKPKLKDWFLGQNQQDQFKRKTEKPGDIYGLVIEESSLEPIPFARIDLMLGEKRITSTTANPDGEYSFKSVEVGRYWIQCNYTGYHEKVKTPVTVTSYETTKVDIALKASAAAFKNLEIMSFSEPVINPDVKSGSSVTREEYQRMATKNVNAISAQTAGVVQYGGGAIYNIRDGRADANEVFIDGQRVIGSSGIPQSAIEQRGWEVTNAFAKENREALNLEYIIDIPYTIPCDGNDYTIRIKEVSVPVEYIYEVIPKIDPDAFLSAEISEWTSLKLISGKASIYYQGTYKGETYLDVEEISDTISLSLGRDNGIIVQREKNKLISEKKILSNAIKETSGIDITLKNNKKTRIRVKVEDQFPIVHHKSMDLNIVQAAGALVDERHGRLKWDIKLEPGEKKILTVQYTLKTPISLND